MPFLLVRVTFRSVVFTCDNQFFGRRECVARVLAPNEEVMLSLRDGARGASSDGRPRKKKKLYYFTCNFFFYESI